MENYSERHRPFLENLQAEGYQVQDGQNVSNPPVDISTQDSSQNARKNRKKMKASASSFQFINLSTPEDASRVENRSLVRRHVWKNIKQERRVVPQNTSKILLPKPTNCSRCINETQIRGTVCEECTELDPNEGSGSNSKAVMIQKLRQPSPLTVISNEDNSLGVYPIKMTPGYHSIIRYLHSGSFDEVASFRKVWFTMTLGDEASFYQILSTMRRHLAVLNGEPDQTESEWLHNKAIVSVRRRIIDPVEALTDGMISSVICFLTYSHITRDIDAFKVHKAGLARMIAMRGGINTLDRDFNVRLMILWDDVCGGCNFNILPIHPIPFRVLSNFQRKWQVDLPVRLSRAIDRWKRIFQNEPGGLDFLEEVHVLKARIEAQLPNVWRDDLFLGIYVNPVLHLLLTPKNLECNGSRSGSIAEMCRLAALLFFADIRIRFLPFHTTGPHFEERLRTLLLQDIDWTSFEELHLWVLTTLLINSSMPHIHRRALLNQLVSLMVSLNLASWDVTIDVLRDFPWLDDIIWMKAEQLGGEIAETIRRIHEY